MLASGDLGWVVMARGEMYAREFGWDASFEALVARLVANYASGHDAEREAVYLARGFSLVEEEPHRSFGADLIGQVYELGLSA